MTFVSSLLDRFEIFILPSDRADIIKRRLLMLFEEGKLISVTGGA
jgi:hypothetical protein